MQITGLYDWGLQSKQRVIYYYLHVLSRNAHTLTFQKPSVDTDRCRSQYISNLHSSTRSWGDIIFHTVCPI